MRVSGRQSVSSRGRSALPPSQTYSRSHLTLRITNDLSSLFRNDTASAWPQRAAHEDHIGTVPARRRKQAKFVLLIKTDIARPLSGDAVDARTSRAVCAPPRRER